MNTVEMTTLSFSLLPESISRLYSLLTCLAKFGEIVAIEARSDKLTLTALNSSRTAYASFALDACTFFQSYKFAADGSSPSSSRFTCQLSNRALQSVFKGRASDLRGRETTIERCEFSVQDQPDEVECRLVVRMLSKSGVTKTFKLTYEAVEIMHALFDRTSATQGWRISARILREYVEYFGPKTEQLDLLAEDGKAIFTSFTEKIQDGKEVLKQPLETAIAIHTQDFEEFHVQEHMHIVISVKDFRAIVTHAETLRCPISAHFSHPTRPLQFRYQDPGMICEFTLMTTGEATTSGMDSTPSNTLTRSFSRQPSIPPNREGSRAASQMPPPALPSNKKPLSSQSQRPSLREQVKLSSMTRPTDHDSDSLFIPHDDGQDDRNWDPPSFAQDDEGEMLGWDASNDRRQNDVHITFRESHDSMRQPQNMSDDRSSQAGLEPTQRLSQLHGLFD